MVCDPQFGRIDREPVEDGRLEPFLNVADCPLSSTQASIKVISASAFVRSMCAAMMSDP